MHADLVATNADFHGDLVRNIRGIRQSQHLFDDLSSDPSDWDVAIAAEGQERIPTEAAFITRPFDYGTVISYSFETMNWHSTRYSDGTRYGVWYGALDIKTTVYETAFHWHRFLLDSFANEDREIRSERRVFDVRCDALLLDLRGKHAAHPELVSRTSYAFCHQLGSYVHEQQLNGLLAQSARHDGINAAVFKPERLSNVRDKMFLTYVMNPTQDQFSVERTPGRVWMRFAPSALA